MASNRILLSAATAAFAALVISTAPSTAEAAAPITVGTLTPGAFFFLTSGTPYSPSITADFGATVTGASTSFSDEFDFTIPQDGTGSGSVSTSFSAGSNELTITSVSIDGVSYTAAQASSGVGGIPIMDGVLNTIDVSGYTDTGATAATFSGTATFAASAAPEPAAWMLMVGGIGVVGVMMRRRLMVASLA